MKFIVLMKRTPDVSLIRVSQGSGDIELPDSGGVNPYDEYAVEEVIRLKEKFGGGTVVLTVGSEKAESAIRECLALGIDEGFLLTDPLFEGSDSQATARILAAGLKKIGDFTLVLGGKQSTDNESGQTPVALATVMNLPAVSFVKKIVGIDGGKITVERTTEDGYDVVECSTPVILSCVKEIADPRLPSLKGKMGAKKKQITKWSAGDLALDGSGLGANSPSKRLTSSPPPERRAGQFIEGETPEEIAENLYQKLKADQALS